MLFFCAMLMVPCATDGASIYRTQCQSCHGAMGEGTKRYKKSLSGDLAVPQLARLIRETMPEGKPNTLSETDAKAVAAFVHGTFYSTAARERNRPPRIELARLTVPQYRQSLADLLGSFRFGPKQEPAEGLKGEYFKNRGFGNGDRVLERVDAGVNLPLGVESPVPGKIEPHEFSMRWTGSVVAPETGDYEFIIRTEHATRLWVNDVQTPIIDAWVKSGSDTEYKGSVRLLAGRAHALRLEYSKAKQGVNDSKKTDKPPPPVRSSIALLWRRPDMPPRLVPPHVLRVSSAAPVFVSSVAFPPDDGSLGWERGSAISKAWDQAATDGALEATAAIMNKIDEFSKSKPADANRSDKLKAFCSLLATRAFRRPISPEIQALYIDRNFARSPDPETGTRRAVLAILKSPRFLYPELEGQTDNHAIAAHLALTLWDGLPDQALNDLAAAGKLKQPDILERETRRMIADARARTKMARFFQHWLRTDHASDLGKDATRFPGFTRDHLASLRESLEWQLDRFWSSESTDYRSLFEGHNVPLDGKLATFYGATRPADAPLADLPLPNQSRAGVITHPYVLAVHAYGSETSPIHRGVFMARNLLGVGLKPPPEAVAPLAPDLHPSLTTRQRVALQTKPAACISCHSLINPLGFTLEGFDAIGRVRTLDNGKQVDTSGAYLDRTGTNHSFKDPLQLAKFLRESPEAHDAFAEQVFHHLAGQPVRAYGADRPKALRERFAADDYSVKKLCAAIALATLTTEAPRMAGTAPAPSGSAR